MVIAGYQPRGGLGRQLIEKHGRETRIHGQDVFARARVATLGGFSGHAGQDELLDWIADQPRVVLVHGEDAPIKAFQQALQARKQDARPAKSGEAIEV